MKNPIYTVDENESLFFDGAPVWVRDQESALDEISTLRDENAPRLVVTLNVDLTLRTQSDATFRRIVRDADLRVLDGAPLVLLARGLGVKSATRITGADLLPSVAGRAVTEGRRLAVLGGAPGTAVNAAKNLRLKFPGLDIVTIDFPFVRDMRDPRVSGIVDELRELAPDYVFVCLGAPKQEKWFATWRDELPPAVYFGAGAAIDFEAGTKKRAPQFVQKIGAEWLWRLAQEPRRLAERYLVTGPRILPLAERSLRRNHSRIPTSAKGSGVEGAMFLSWISFHGRSDGITRELGTRGFYIDGGEGNRLVRYIRQWRQTQRLLERERPQTILLMQPPVIALWSLLRYARSTGARIAGDLHTGVFDDPTWSWATRNTLKLLRKYGLAIVTNDALAETAEDIGCPTIVMHDRIEEWTRDLTAYDDPKLERIGSPSVLVPLAYAHDEPLDELLQAARETPDVQWVFTGKAPEKIRAAAPSNVVFSGFVTNDDFLRLASRTDVTLAITMNENTMQRAGYESLSLGKNLVTSNTRVLREYFADATQIVEPTAPSLVAGVRAALADEEAEKRMIALRTVRMREQDEAMKQLREWIELA